MGDVIKGEQMANIDLTEQMINNLSILADKEAVLSNIITWLNAKGLMNECARDIGLAQYESFKSGRET